MRLESAAYASPLTTFLGKAGYVYSDTPLLFGFGAWNEEWFWQESPVWQDAAESVAGSMIRSASHAPP